MGPSLRLRPRLAATTTGGLVLGPTPWLKLPQALLAAGAWYLGASAFFGEGLSSLMWYSLALILGAGILSVDSFRFSPTSPALVRRSGLWPFLRRWSLPLERLRGVALQAGAAGEGLFGLEEGPARLESNLYGMARHPWVALYLTLDDGRSLVLATGRPGDRPWLRAYGARLASLLGLPLLDNLGD